jgi:hypothetical protein
MGGVDAVLAKSFSDAARRAGWTEREVDEALVRIDREMRSRRNLRSEMHG